MRTERITHIPIQYLNMDVSIAPGRLPMQRHLQVRASHSLLFTLVIDPLNAGAGRDVQPSSMDQVRSIQIHNDRSRCTPRSRIPSACYCPCPHYCYYQPPNARCLSLDRLHTLPARLYSPLTHPESTCFGKLHLQSPTHRRLGPKDNWELMDLIDRLKGRELDD